MYVHLPPLSCLIVYQRLFAQDDDTGPDTPYETISPLSPAILHLDDPMA